MEPTTPTSSEGRPVVYAADQPQYRPLPARVTDEGRVITEWSLTEEERQRIASGENVRLTILTFGQPLQAVLLEITSEHE